MTNAPFKPDDIKEIINKAKRKSLIRNIVITTICLLVLGTLMILGNAAIVRNAGEKAVKSNDLLVEIMQPNVKISSIKFNYGILSGDYTFQKYKLIEGKVVPWGEEQNTFNVLARNEPSALITNNDVVENKYNPTNGQRTMLFYHPWFEYTTIENDLSLIEGAPENAVMEVAVSFDQPFSVNEIQDFLNLKEKITWYWVNEYNQKDREQLAGEHSSGDSYVFGFNAQTLRGEGDIVVQNEEGYMDSLNRLKSQGSYDYIVDRLLDSLKQNQKEGLILGVVVTGTKEELLKLKEEKHVRGISLGAVAKEY